MPLLEIRPWPLVRNLVCAIVFLVALSVAGGVLWQGLRDSKHRGAHELISAAERVDTLFRPENFAFLEGNAPTPDLHHVTRSIIALEVRNDRLLASATLVLGDSADVRALESITLYSPVPS